MKQNLRKHAMAIFKAGLEAADPKKAVLAAMQSPAPGVFVVAGQTLDLDHFDRVFVIGSGKAACPMALALEQILPKISAGKLTTKYGHVLDMKNIRATEAGHPVPDENGLVGTREILDILKNATKKDLIFCVISGGGSSLMPMPVSGITLAQKQETTLALLACGATIHEINTIRKHISIVKGGGLAKAAYPAKMVTLVLSDVIGDDLDIIASGPTVPDTGTFDECLRIIDRYHIRDKIPQPVLDHLKKGTEKIIPETPKNNDPIFENTFTTIIGSARQSLFAARQAAKNLDYDTMILSSVIQGETRDAAKIHAAIAEEILATRNPLAPPACVLSGGETTVTIKGSGMGGRNMEFALAAAIEIQGLKNVLVFSAGTDGTDGPTDAAGAVADGHTIDRADKLGLDATSFLDKNDSYNFFKPLGDLIITGPTMTNVMDLRIILVI